MLYYLNYIIASILVAATAISGSYFTNKNSKSTWYDCIKPKGTPPSYVFPIAWTTIYILLIIALGRTLGSTTLPPSQYILLLLLFIVNFTLNSLWCWAYFDQKRIKLAFLLIILIALTIVAIIFASRDIVVSLLLLPYLGWVSFATYLNYKSIEKEAECNSIEK